MRKKQTINYIQQVNFDEPVFSTEVFRIIFTCHAELNLDGFTAYVTLPGSKKKYNKCVVPVPRKEMEQFFSELYEFVRGAETCRIEIDNYISKVTFIYSSGFHKEIFTSRVFNGKEELTYKISGFLDDHGVNDYRNMSGYEYLFPDLFNDLEKQ